MVQIHSSPSTRRAGHGWHRSALVVALLTTTAACSGSWENEHLFTSGSAQVNATATRLGNPDLPNHYSLEYRGSVGKRGFATVGGATPMPGEPVGMKVGDVNGDGADDIVVLFAASLGGTATTPRLHVRLQQRTETSMAMGEVLTLPALTEAQAPGGADAASIEIVDGALVLRFRAPLSVEERAFAFDFEADRWVSR